MNYFSSLSQTFSFEEEDKNRIVILLRFIFISTLLVNILATLSDLSVTGFAFEALKDNLIILLLQIVLALLIRKGYVGVVAVIFTVLLWLMVAFASAVNNGILNPLYGAEILTILVAGLLINGWAALGFAVLSSVFGLWLVQHAEIGLYANQVGALSVRDAWLNDTVAFIVSSVLIFLSMRAIEIARKRTAQEALSRSQSEEALRASEARLSAILASAMDAIITLDDQQNTVYFNSAAEKMFQWAADKAIGQPISRFIPEQAGTGPGANVLKFGQTNAMNQQMGSLTATSGLRANGSEFPVEVSIAQFKTSVGNFIPLF